ncbi:MAG TPA: ABC-2 family transporter protein [Chloroflexota bacterium]|nr:ABC-2 family transporter protein [Chloroflexota bacterium]
MSALLAAYVARFKVAIAVQFQYRVALVIWLSWTIMESVIYLVVWSTVARSSGGRVGTYDVQDFAAYFLVSMIVNHLTFTWIMYEFEYRVRQGLLSPLLLKPLHPIHGDVAENVTYKALTAVVLVPAVALLVVAFEPALHPEPWAVAAFLLSLILAFFVRFLAEWTVALTGFWTTRVMAINEMYGVTMLFLSGLMVPLSLLPWPIQVVASALPFRWMVAFPVELLLGRVGPQEALFGFGAQAGWILAMATLAALVWRVGMRRYSAVGA